MPQRPEHESSDGPDRLVGAWLADLQRVDEAVYLAIAGTATPSLDRGLTMLSHAANYSRLWLGSSAVLALVGGPRGRRAAVQGLTAVGVTSAVVNVVVKQAGRRARPSRPTDQAPERSLRMPASRSFPSGHSAAAFAFATGVGHRLPVVAVPLYATAGLVAYSRVHTGVHYPGDVVVGSILGSMLAQLTSRAVDHFAAGS